MTARIRMNSKDDGVPNVRADGGLSRGKPGAWRDCRHHPPAHPPGNGSTRTGRVPASGRGVATFLSRQTPVPVATEMSQLHWMPTRPQSTWISSLEGAGSAHERGNPPPDGPGRLCPRLTDRSVITPKHNRSDDCNVQLIKIGENHTVIRSNMRKWLHPILMLLIGGGLTLLAQRSLSYSSTNFPVKHGMTEPEVIKNLGKPRNVEAIFSVLPPDDWPDSAKDCLLKRKPSIMCKYSSVEIYFLSGKVCDVRPLRWCRF